MTGIDWSITLNICFGVIGLIGTVFGVFSWYQSQRTTKRYEYLLDIADKNIDKNVTEKELARKREDIREATEQVRALQNHIEKQIPIEARRTVLKDRLNAEVELLHRTRNNVVLLKQELTEMGEFANIPRGLMRSIEAEISPEYLMREKRSTLKTYLTIVTTASAIASSLLNGTLRELVTFPLLILGILFLVRLLKLSLHQSAYDPNKIVARIDAWFRNSKN